MVGVSARPKLRYRWSHRHPAHRALVKAANHVLPLIPFGVKYAVTDAVRRRNFPYKLLHPGSVAIQIGAPRDTLRAGRSRAMAFVRLTAPNGRVLVVEPDAASAEEFRRTAARHGLGHAEVANVAAWNEATTLTMEVDPTHPATNFTAGSTQYAPEEMVRFRELQVEAAPVDELAERAGIDRVDLVSITTNGAESEILRGMSRILERERPYICLARTEDSYADLMAELDYELLSDDDRGFTFRHRGGARG
jgi:FkbM family methyltransferase